MKKFLIKFLFLLPIGFLIIGINCFVDPAYLFKNKTYEDGIAEILSENKNVGNVTNYDERLVQKYYINKMKDKKEVVVFGSSRCMQIDRSFFPDRSFFNSSVTGATVEDSAAIYYLYRKNKKIPKTIVFCLDPWVLNKNNEQIRFSSLESEYLKMLKIIGIKNHNIGASIIPAKYLQVLSLTYFQASVDKLFDDVFNNGRHKKGDYFATDKEYAEYPIKKMDGSYSYDLKMRTLDYNKVKASAAAYAKDKNVYAISRYDEIDLGLKNQLEKLIDLILKDNVTLVLFLPPYHKDAFDILTRRQDTKIIMEAQAYFKQLAKAKGLIILGDNDPSIYNLDNEDFYDGMHPKKSGINKIFNKLDANTFGGNL